MGRMSFPENEERPSRTITATKIGTSREAIVYRSEYNRKGNGEYRTPTVREAACIMGFPITFQFLGSESIKWRLVGNAVCPSISRALASIIRREIKLRRINIPIIKKKVELEDVKNLNTFQEKKFSNPPQKNSGSRFRRHLFKDGNITVTLSNYDIKNNGKDVSRWLTSVQYGTGEGFPSYSYPDNYYKKLRPIIEKFEKGKEFLEQINNGFSRKIASKKLLQEMHETQRSIKGFFEPIRLINEVAKLIKAFSKDNDFFTQNGIKVFEKKAVPQKQLYALYALNKIITIVNNS
jgi:DNA (cytosine-5)-methyltransferase 1